MTKDITYLPLPVATCSLAKREKKKEYYSRDATTPIVIIMVSGYGARGGRGRCFSLWQDFMRCISDAGKVSLDVCHSQREDYLECLHHHKLV